VGGRRHEDDTLSVGNGAGPRSDQTARFRKLLILIKLPRYDREALQRLEGRPKELVCLQGAIRIMANNILP